MPLDFSPLQTIDPAGAFYRGQEAARAEQDRNMMRRFQMEQGLAQRENIYAQRQERQALAAQRQRELEQANKLQAYIESGMPQGEEALLQYGKAGTQAAEELRKMRGGQIEQEKRLLDFVTPRLAAATEQTYPFIRSDIARISPKFAEGLPLNYDEATVKAIARQGMAIKDQIEAASGRQQYMNTPYGPFDPRTGEFKMPSALPARAPAPGAAPPTPAAPKPPVGYRFTDSGNLEPIPGGPAARKVAGAGAAPAAPGAPAAKPPTAAQAAKTEAQAQARQALSQDLQTVLGYYNSLNEMGGMTSPTRSIAENVLASARATGVGQEAERTVGTQAQTLRDNISNSRQRLLVHIKNATGASAQQMNSNVELQTWLNALTNPRQSIETVRETLGQLDSVIASVQNQVNKETPAKPAAAAPAPAPKSRDLGGGFKLVD